MTHTPEKWLSTYYPTPASEFNERDRTIGTVLDAVDHSIRKWSGLSPEVLAQHGLKKEASRVLNNASGKTVLQVDDDSCALCATFPVYSDAPSSCPSCPLFLVRGGVPCDSMSPAEYARSLRPPYQTWRADGDERPMVRWLKRARAFVLKTDRKLNEGSQA